MDKAKLKDLGVPEEILDAVFDAVLAEIDQSVNTALENAEKNNTGISEEEKAELIKRAEAAEGKISEMEKKHAAEKLFSGYAFTSELAKEAAFKKFMESDTPFENGIFSGGEDWLNKLKEENPTAFLSETPPPKLMTGAAGGSASESEDAAIDKLMGIE